MPLCQRGSDGSIGPAGDVATIRRVEALTVWLMRPGVPDLPMTFEERLNRPAWQDAAACRGQGAGEWVTSSRSPSAYRAQKSVCMRCPVRKPCLAYALEHPDLVGCWGGTNDVERRQMRKAPLAPRVHAV